MMKIKSIKKIDNDSKRYDIQTESGNFFANSILVHNSLISVYHDGNDWHVCTRKTAYAEGETPFGRTFSEIFWEIANKIDLKKKLYDLDMVGSSITFELTTPENRVVTPYKDYSITLIGCRVDNDEEMSFESLESLSKSLGVPRPKTYQANSLQELVEIANSLPPMEEGFVIATKNKGSRERIKVKNAKYLAIAHMRNNGVLSPKRVLTLIMANDHQEYLSYFEEDRTAFGIVEKEYLESIKRLQDVYDQVSHIESQKEFALTMIPLTKHSFEKGVLFAVRKKGTSITEEIEKISPKDLAESMKLKEALGELFRQNNIDID